MKELLAMLSRPKGGLAALVALSTAMFMGVPNAHAGALHGFCNGTAPACIDNGTNTPLGNNSTNFGFWMSGGPETGNLYIDLLLSNNYALPVPNSFALTGTHGGTTNT